MAELKTQPNDGAVEEFLNGIQDEGRRQDALAVLRLMQEVTGEKPRMWGESIVGFGAYRYRYESGREGDWFLSGFSPRKGNLTLYLMSGFDGCDDLMGSLGKFKTGKSCLYLKRLEDVDLPTLRELLRQSVEYMRRTYGG